MTWKEKLGYHINRLCLNFEVKACQKIKEKPPVKAALPYCALIYSVQYRWRMCRQLHKHSTACLLLLITSSIAMVPNGGGGIPPDQGGIRSHEEGM